MSKNIRISLIVLMGLLALVTVVGIVYGIQNKEKTTEIYDSYNENIIEAVDSAVKLCQGAFASAEATDDELINLNEYIENIENAKSPVLKAYIADSMLTYTGDFLMVKEQNYIAGIEGSKPANYRGTQEKLLMARTKLTNARNYGSNDTSTDNYNTTAAQ